MELRGFEPPTSGVEAPAVTAPSLQGLILREGPILAKDKTETGRIWTYTKGSAV